MSESEASRRLGVVLERHVARCVRELCEAHGLELDVQVAPEPEAGEQPNYTFAGIIGLVGDLSGTLLIGGDATLLNRSHPLRRSKPKLSMYDQLDWIGELSNQLTGRLKKRLIAHGIEFDFSPPISVTGERLKHVPSRGTSHRASFRSSADGVIIGIWLDVAISEAAAARPEFFTDGDEVDGAEGTIQLF